MANCKKSTFERWKYIWDVHLAKRKLEKSQTKIQIDDAYKNFLLLKNKEVSSVKAEITQVV